jgi:transcriptional regulator with XRE-family HTH domain
MKKDKSGFAERFAMIRKKLGFNQGDFAQKMGLSKPTILRYETDGGYPDAGTLLKLIQGYDVNINWLLTGKGDMFIKDITKMKDIDFEEYQEDMEELLYFIREVPRFRYPVLKFFIHWKVDNRELIDELNRAKTENGGQPCM